MKELLIVVHSSLTQVTIEIQITKNWRMKVINFKRQTFMYKAKPYVEDP